MSVDSQCRGTDFGSRPVTASGPKCCPLRRWGSQFEGLVSDFIRQDELVDTAWGR
jgi:hypothetical protein